MSSSKTFAILLSALLLLSVACAKGPSDESIAADIKSKMFSDPALKTTQLNVSVANGEATLSGQVPSADARLQAYKIAEQTTGVKKVNDQMTVAEATAQRSAPAVRTAPPPAPGRPATSEPLRPAPSETAPASQARTVSFPVGTTLTVRMIDGIDSKVNTAGQTFKASLASPLTSGDQVIVPAGTDATVKLVAARSAGRVTGRSELQLDLASLNFQGRSYPLDSTTIEESGGSRGKQTAIRTGVGAGLGAAIGAAVGGGKGAAIGAGVGGGSAATYQILTHGEQVKVPSETKLDFRLERPLDVSYSPRAGSQRTPVR